MKFNCLFRTGCVIFVLFVASQSALSTEALEPKINKVLSGDHRSSKNKARDQYRHPSETLSFFGLNTRARVLEISPGRGWYTEVLAPLLRDSGQFYVATWDISSVSEKMRPFLEKIDRGYRNAIKENPSVYDQINIITYDTKKPQFLSPQAFDFVLTFRNVHNWAKGGTAELMFQAFFNTLKPGGILGVTDHRAKPGTSFELQTKSGYMTENYVISLAEKIGFELVAKSELNANYKDTTNHPGGVWNLPPTLRNVADTDKETYLSIGESDRMTLKFRKPKK